MNYKKIARVLFYLLFADYEKNEDIYYYEEESYEEFEN